MPRLALSIMLLLLAPWFAHAQDEVLPLTDRLLQTSTAQAYDPEVWQVTSVPITRADLAVAWEAMPSATREPLIAAVTEGAALFCLRPAQDEMLSVSLIEMASSDAVNIFLDNATAMNQSAFDASNARAAEARDVAQADDMTPNNPYPRYEDVVIDTFEPEGYELTAQRITLTMRVPGSTAANVIMLRAADGPLLAEVTVVNLELSDQQLMQCLTDAFDAARESP